MPAKSGTSATVASGVDIYNVAGNLPLSLDRRVATTTVHRKWPSRETRHLLFQVRTAAKIASFKKRQAGQRTRGGWTRVAKQNLALAKLQHQLRHNVRCVHHPTATLMAAQGYPQLPARGERPLHDGVGPA